MKKLVAALCALASGALAQAGPIAQTTEGPVQGLSANGVNSFLGIRYAAPPVAAARWTPPGAPPQHQGTTVQATAYGAYCPQGISQIGGGGGNEDCLFVNVQTPANATTGSNLPVMVWIHGGGLTTGSGQEYDGQNMVREGNVVYVNFNYRLGLLGFLAHPALAAEDKQHHSSGNYGLLDQQAAMAWAKANAKNFGGNPNDILFFGESAGGQSTIDQLTSPATIALKPRAAIIESGAYARTYPTQAQGRTQGVAIGDSLGCPSQTDASCLRAVSVAQLLAVVGTNVLQSGGVNITPNVDGYVLPMQPFQALYSGAFARIPVIDGTNHDEYRLFISENDLIGSGPITTYDEYAGYVAAVAAMSGADANTLLLTYPYYAYPYFGYAISALVTDYAFACGAILADALISQYVPTYSYELNDPNWPNIFLPFDPNMPSLGDPHAGELPYLYPQFRNSYLGLGPAQFSAAQLQLTQTMRADWTSTARYGRPLSPKGGIWPRYTIGTHAKLSLVPPSPQTELGFVANHHCDVWLPFLLAQAQLPAGTPY